MQIRALAPFALMIVPSFVACSGGSAATGPSGNGSSGGGGSSGSATSSSGSATGSSSGTAASSSGSTNGSSSGTSANGSSGGASSSGAGSSGGGSSGAGSSGGSGGDAGAHAIKTVFVILMENTNWSTVTGDANATYINGTLLQSGVYCDNYYDNPKSVHPSEPNYIWIESGDNLGFTTDDPPSKTHIQPAGTDHLVMQLTNAGVSWHMYEESLGSGICGINASADGLYAPKHDPAVFFQDVVGATPSDTAPACADHIFDYSQLATDLAGGTVAQYNFITPNLCDDMHGPSSLPNCANSDLVVDGDTWLSNEVPRILASDAYKNNGALFITWDESEPATGTTTPTEFPIGMIVLSPLAKTAGYVSHTKYYHSSLLRTVETIFGVPFLRDAANQSDLSDLFTTFP